MAGDDEYKGMNVWAYDLLLWIMTVIVDLFFREIHPRSSWRIPKKGAVIFVAAPHANQFVDPLILMRVIRREAGRRVAILIAEKSMKRQFIGTMSGALGALSVGRALDSTKPVPGRIYLPDPDNDPTLVRGIDTDFKDSQFQIGGLLVLPSVNNEAANSEIADILSSTELRLKKPLKGDVAMQQVTGRRMKEAGEGKQFAKTQEQIERNRNEDGTTFKVAPKVDQSQVYNAVFDKLSRGGCIGIYPEGGSHDRTELLPLKAGVAIMALGAKAADPGCDVKIVPCGMNYFHAHKFRSRAVIEFGAPLDVPQELVDEYQKGSKREAVGQMLQIVYDALVSVTVTSPDYETLMLIQAVRRLYNPKNKPLPLPMVVELNRRLVKGYTHYKDDPRIISLRKNVMTYHKSLMALNVRDHQLGYARLSIVKVLATLAYRTGKLALLSAAVLPGLVLFAPIFIAGKIISIRKSREALAASTVKVQARDVVATWKLLVAMALAPSLYAIYTILLGLWTYYNRVHGIVPDWVPIWLVMFLGGFIVFPIITFAALRFGEIGMDIAKSLRPLVLCLNPSADNVFVKLRSQREELAGEVTRLINELGPELFPDFDAHRIVAASDTRPAYMRPQSERDTVQLKTRQEGPEGVKEAITEASASGTKSMTSYLPRNESFKNLTSFSIFSSRPPTPSSERSRSRPGSRSGFGLQGLSKIDRDQSGGTLEDVNRSIQGALRERGRSRAEGAGGGGGGGGSGGGGAAAGESEDSEGDETNGVAVEMKKQQ